MKRVHGLKCVAWWSGLALALTGCPDDPALARTDAANRDVVDSAVDANVDASDGAMEAATCGFSAREDALPTPPIHTPRWAFEPWISKDISNGADTYAFVDGFRSRDIPVGVVVLDSPWETQYNTFVPNPMRYPNFGQMVTDMHSRNVRVVLWVTALVNSRSYDLEPGGDQYVGPAPNFEEGRVCGFFVNNGAVYNWWKGLGASVDFFHAGARAWWHRQQDPLLDMGIDGWKLDFGDSYVNNQPVVTAMGSIPHQQYSEEYYRDFWAYGVSKRGRENFVTMVRPYDKSYQFQGRFFARKEHAPVTWVGDNRRDWVGLSDALDHMFRSAAAGYVMVGSDVGGYLDVDDQMLTTQVPFSQDTFLRWVALGAMGPFMQLHGRANLTPWTIADRPDETLRAYRYWSKLHHALVPFFYSLAEQSYASNGTILHPQGTEASWAGDYRFLVGDAFLVAPVLNGNGQRDVELPSGKWLDFWNRGGNYVTGGQVLRQVDTTDRTRIPVYVRAGAIVPLQVEDDIVGLGTAASANALTVWVLPDTTQTMFALHETDGMTTQITTQSTASGSQTTLSRATRTTLLRIRCETAPNRVLKGTQMVSVVADRAAFDAATEGTYYDATERVCHVKLAPSAGSVSVSTE